jgi:DsbC/DsbD-like thiol-disulfide interchange protein
MRKTRLVLLAILSAAAPSALAQEKPAPTPIKWTLTVDANAKPDPNAAFKAVLKATIEEGWHLYAMSLPPNGPTSTQISVPAGQPFSLNGSITAAPGITAFDPNFGMSLESYENDAVFTIPVKVAANAGGPPLTLTVLVGYQTCDAHVCLPPTDVKVTATIK